MNHPLLLDLSVDDLMLEEMMELIEWELSEREGVTLREFEAIHMWPDDKEVNPGGFSAILKDAYERLGDWDQAYEETRQIMADARERRKE